MPLQFSSLSPSQATISWGPRTDPIPVWINSTPQWSPATHKLHVKADFTRMNGNLRQTRPVQAPMHSIDPNLFAPSVSTRPHEIYPPYPVAHPKPARVFDFPHRLTLTLGSVVIT
ncbi:hypothetical protein B0H13DRAFT_1886120 [Mycena leptocephala]|nr:hypothetical protein B0H13DRAFT_1886120 [Mycena leptocephala]